ncbi:sce7725 family protein [Chungangia koreensis]|uniref:Sce7725 family protein n=1 Tax=Chungangia koreensis TaxID=752657 RepID=A0ABV8X272_9LACT
MYYPFIRGRQYDLLALRELQSKELLSNKIVPIIEPIKMSSTLSTTVKIFNEAQRNLIIITNPKVGSFTGELEFESIKQQFKEILSYEYIYPAVHLNRESFTHIERIQRELEIELSDFALIHSDRSLVSKYKEFFNDFIPSYNIIPSENSFRRLLRGQNIIGLDDKFNKLLRNADYLEQVSEFFSEEHLFYSEEGYIGFSDYSVVGEEYSESGFAPYAVAIHIVYPNADDALEIMHFVSDSNDDISDPAGKFSEALRKLIEWYEGIYDDRMDTLAMRVFSEHYKEGTYPGLPTLKKLSIMHHLELMGKLLE